MAIPVLCSRLYPKITAPPRMALDSHPEQSRDGFLAVRTVLRMQEPAQEFPVVITALLDRLLPHAVVIRIEGASYRLRKHADHFLEHVRANAPIMPPPKTRDRTKRETRSDD